MSQQEDFSKPRNLAASLFRSDLGDFELPENSNIQKLKQPEVIGNVRQSRSKYQDDDDDFLDINLGIHSHLAPKAGENSSASTSSAHSRHLEPEPRPQPTATKQVAPSKIHRRGKKPEPEKKKEVDIDGEIGEIAEWAEKGARNNSDEEDFDHDNEPQRVGESSEQLEIRRKLQEKLKAGFGGERKQAGGLRAKAEQLRKQNEQKTKLPEVVEKSAEDSKPSKEVRTSLKTRPSKEQRGEQEHNRSSMHLVEPRPPVVVAANFKQEQQDDDIDDHWNKINSQTINQITAVQEKRKQMTLKSVLTYYEKEFQFQEAEIDEEAIGVDFHANEEEEEETGCLAALCACFTADKRQEKNKFNSAVAKRLVAISKKHLSTGDEEFFILKEIWTRLTGKEFSRYGGHWNEIGFQGRDPATDLRSTGVLSLLQWVQFIEAHPKLSDKYYGWSVEHDYPLALTFIKLTGVFLDLLARGSIVAEDWAGFQQCFNCLVWGMFGKMMEKYKFGDTLGNFVEEQAKEIKKDYKKLLASYRQEFKQAK